MFKKSTLAYLTMGLALLATTTQVQAENKYKMRVMLPGLRASADSPNKSIVQQDGIRQWSDGSAAPNCKSYLAGDASHSYSGSTGSGFYQLQTSAGSVSAYCDMDVDGGGWTLAVRVGVATTEHTNPGALPISAPFQYATGKLSDSVINALSGETLRINYGDSLAQDVVYSKIDAAHLWSSNSNTYLQDRLVSNSLNGPYVIASNIYYNYTGFGLYVDNPPRWTLPVSVNYSESRWGGMEWNTHGQWSLGTVWVR